MLFFANTIAESKLPELCTIENQALLASVSVISSSRSSELKEINTDETDRSQTVAHWTFPHKNRPRGYKTFFMLNSVEHEI